MTWDQSVGVYASKVFPSKLSFWSQGYGKRFGDPRERFSHVKPNIAPCGCMTFNECLGGGTSQIL